MIKRQVYFLRHTLKRSVPCYSENKHTLKSKANIPHISIRPFSAFIVAYVQRRGRWPRAFWRRNRQSCVYSIAVRYSRDMIRAS